MTLLLRFFTLILIVQIPFHIEASPIKESKVQKKTKASISSNKSKGTLVKQEYKYNFFIPTVGIRSIYQVNSDFKDFKLTSVPANLNFSDGFFFVFDQNGNKIVLTLNPRIQKIIEEEVQRTRSHTVAVVFLEVKTGRILGYYGASVSIPNPVLYDGFKIASLFKIITAAAAIDFMNVSPYTYFAFRGGLYELSRNNFYPDYSRDFQRMTLEESLAKSVNPVFARLALQYLDDKLLSFYSDRFGFNVWFPSDFYIPKSRGYIPSDKYELARVSAGFGAIFLTPIHAASIISSIGNRGFMMSPKLIEFIISKDGKIIYTFKPSVISKVVTESSAKTLLDSMISTHTVGTASKSFKNSPVKFLVSGKTGTLSIENPKGLMRSYVATFPANSPKYALSVFVVNALNESSKATEIGRRIIERISYDGF